MNEVHKKSFKLVDEFINSDEGKLHMKKYFRKISAQRLRLKKKFEFYSAMSDAEFKEIVIKEAEKHGYDWTNKCYKKGHESYPKPILSNIIKVMLEYGKQRNIPNNHENMFTSVIAEFKGLKVFQYNGQGTFFRIYNKKKLLIQT